MSADPTLLRRLIAGIEAEDIVEDFTRKLDAILRACELLLRLNDLQERRMSALTDSLTAQIDRIAARIADSVSIGESLATLQQQKADVEAQFSALQAQFDEQSASLQAAIDRLASM